MQDHLHHIKGIVAWISSTLGFLVGLTATEQWLRILCLMIGGICSILGCISYWYNIKEKRKLLKK